MKSNRRYCRNGFEKTQWISIVNAHERPLFLVEETLSFFPKGLAGIILTSIHEPAVMKNAPCFVSKEKKFENPTCATQKIIMTMHAYARLINDDYRTAWSLFPHCEENHQLKGMWMHLDYAKSLTVFHDDLLQLDEFAAQLSKKGYCVCTEEDEESAAPLSSSLCLPSTYKTMADNFIQDMDMKPCE